MQAALTLPVGVFNFTHAPILVDVSVTPEPWFQLVGLPLRWPRSRSRPARPPASRSSSWSRRQARKTVIRELERVIGASVTAIPTAECATTRALVYSPCAVGGVITDKNIETLGAKIICGAANLQLAVDTYDHALVDVERTLWVPDILVNAGAVIEGFWAAQQPGIGRAELDAAIDAIGPRTTRLLETASARGISPATMARLHGRHYGDDSLP